MKKLFYIGFCLVLAMGLGCAITDYDVITDNDQVKNGGSGVVNTNGKAKITPSAQIATTYSDGTDELFSMVDQKSDGTGTITTYNNFSSGSDPIFHDDLYCNPDWNGCSIFTAPDNNDGNLFDGSANNNCSGARSLSVLLSTSRYYGECGRARVDMNDRLTVLNSGQVNAWGGLAYNLNRGNFGVRLQKEGAQIVNVPVFGNIAATITMDGGRRAHLDLQNSMISNSIDAIHSTVASHGAGAYTIYLDYMGVTVDLPIAFTDPADIREFNQMKF